MQHFVETQRARRGRGPASQLGRDCARWRFIEGREGGEKEQSTIAIGDFVAAGGALLKVGRAGRRHGPPLGLGRGYDKQHFGEGRDGKERVWSSIAIGEKLHFGRAVASGNF